MAASKYAIQQSNRLQRINDSYMAMHAIVIILCLGLGIITAMLIHVATGANMTVVAFSYYVIGLIAGLVLYRITTRILIQIVVLLVRMAGEPVKIRDSKGRFIKLDKNGKPMGYVDIPHLNGEKQAG